MSVKRRAVKYLGKKIARKVARRIITGKPKKKHK